MIFKNSKIKWHEVNYVVAECENFETEKKIIERFENNSVTNFILQKICCSINKLWDYIDLTCTADSS